MCASKTRFDLSALIPNVERINIRIMFRVKVYLIIKLDTAKIHTVKHM